jgi:hypothetical protein
LGQREWAVESQLEPIIEHLLKLEYSPSRALRRQWMISINSARGEIERRLTPSVRREVGPGLATLNQPAFRPDTWHEQGGLGISPSTGLCRTSTVASR